MCGDYESLLYFRLKPGWDELTTLLGCIQCERYTTHSEKCDRSFLP